MGSIRARPSAIRCTGRISARAKIPTESTPIMCSPWLVFRLVSMRHAAFSRVGMTKNFVCLQASIVRLTAYTRFLC